MPAYKTPAAASVIVVDDEPKTAAEICSLADKTGILQVTGKFSDPSKALESVKWLRPDAAMVDIEMPGMNGIDLANEILRISPKTQIVFITGWDQYAVKAFELNALDYLLKPVKPERFALMAERIRKQVAERQPENKLKIQVFDKLEVTIGGTPVKWQRTKSAELFAYLLMNHGEYIHKDTLLDVLWQDYRTIKALPILQTSVCKIRQIFSTMSHQVELDYSASRYCLLIRDAECDYFSVEQAIYDYKPSSMETFAAVEKACDLFNKGFLTQQGYLWSMEKDEQLRQSLIRILREIIAVYSSQNNISARIRALSLAAKMAPYDEELNYTLLRELIRQKKIRELTAHCVWLDRVLKEEYDIVPSAQLQELLQKYRKPGIFPHL